MAITNQAKPTTSLTNSAKINIGETWGSDLNTWATELRTWAETVSIISNVTKVSSSMTNTAKP